MKALNLFLLLFFYFLSISNIHGQVPQKNNSPFHVVTNHEEQYLIIPANQENPPGWHTVSFKGSLNACRDYIEEVWTDMRPLSIRKMNLPRETRYAVVINHEEQYSVWPAHMKAPEGWKFTKVAGDLGHCMDYIEEVWTDMRPLSMRKRQLK